MVEAATVGNEGMLGIEAFLSTRRSKTNSQTLTLGSLGSAETSAVSAGFSQGVTNLPRSPSTRGRNGRTVRHGDLASLPV